jgi:uncharacterized protein (UPF0147 family)
MIIGALHSDCWMLDAATCDKQAPKNDRRAAEKAALKQIAANCLPFGHA